MAALQIAFLEFHLLYLRSEPLTPRAFAQLARLFGTPQIQLIADERQADAPEVSRLETTYRSAAGKPDDMRLVRLSGWHTDDSYFPVPAKATMLQALAIPDSGGQTRFANMRTAYRDLTDVEKVRIQGLCALHRYDTTRAKARPIQLTTDEEAELQDAVHPLVRRHDDTGEMAIYTSTPTGPIASWACRRRIAMPCSTGSTNIRSNRSISIVMTGTSGIC